MKPDFAYEDSEELSLMKELVLQVRKTIGPFAAPKRIILVGDLPKTRSGKIMRRILRKISAGEADSLGDLSTLADPSIVESIVRPLSSLVHRCVPFSLNRSRRPDFLLTLLHSRLQATKFAQGPPK